MTVGVYVLALARSGIQKLGGQQLGVFTPVQVAVPCDMV